MIEWLKNRIDPIHGDRVYPLDDARERFTVRELMPNAYLVLNFENDWLKFAVLEFSSSNVDGSETMLSCLFHGEGPGMGLRECRHTWWGEDGYLFYPDGRVIAAAFAALSEFFDDMK